MPNQRFWLFLGSLNNFNTPRHNWQLQLLTAFFTKIQSNWSVPIIILGQGKMACGNVSQRICPISSQIVNRQSMTLPYMRREPLKHFFYQPKSSQKSPDASDRASENPIFWLFLRTLEYFDSSRLNQQIPLSTLLTKIQKNSKDKLYGLAALKQKIA